MTVSNQMIPMCKDTSTLHQFLEFVSILIAENARNVIRFIQITSLLYKLRSKIIPIIFSV